MEIFLIVLLGAFWFWCGFLWGTFRCDKDHVVWLMQVVGRDRGFWEKYFQIRFGNKTMSSKTNEMMKDVLSKME